MSEANFRMASDDMAGDAERRVAIPERKPNERSEFSDGFRRHGR